MPFFKNASNFQMTSNKFQDIAGNLYTFGHEEQAPIDILKELSVNEAIINLRYPARYESTAIPILKELQKWMSEERVPVLFLSGPSGSGKTTIAQTFAYACNFRANYPVISFSFSRGNPLRSDFHRIFPTLCAQLHELPFPALSNTINGVLESDSFIFSRSLDQQFHDLIIYPIRQSFLEDTDFSTNRTFVIVLDGLDACDDQRILKRFFSEIKAIIADESYYSRIKILCTSNHDPAILTSFRSIISYFHHTPLKDYDANEDIKMYLSGRLERWMDNRAADWPWSDLIDYMLSKASGNFGSAALMLDRIEESGMDNPESVKNILDGMSGPGYTVEYSTLSDVALQMMDHSTRQDISASPLEILVSILRKREPEEPIHSLVNPGIVDFMSRVLSAKDYVNIASQIDDTQDAENLLEFLICLLDHGLLVKTDLRDANRRARRFIIKLATKTHTIPPSLYLKDVIQSKTYPIGRGGFASVYEGRYRGIRVALKMLNNVGLNVDFHREALTWRTLSHEYVLPFMGVFQENESYINIVSPFMENGTLREWRKKKNPSVSDIEQRMLEVAEGIQYLHYEGIIHGDINGSNILLDADFHVRISDFGVTRHADATATKTYALSTYFSAPELFDDGDDEDAPYNIKRTEKTDVFAYGCTYYEIYFDRMPLQDIRDIYVSAHILRGRRDIRRSEPPLDDRTWSLIELSWQQNSGRRPSMDDVVETMVAWHPSSDF
ncbi:hypothetical protein AX17_006538 [Amanita inopinata Kibby_2008]|nr:hypothetical protein AX17_006538 [Amanita inopinata Kibby_2008]